MNIEQSNVSRSLIIPIYKNEANIEALLFALDSIQKRSTSAIEIVFVIDGSPDRSGEMLVLARENGRMNYPSQIIFHSRNFGSFTAIRTGLEFAKGQYYSVMAADLQEPPELVLTMLDLLERKKADIIFGKRNERDDSWLRDKLSNAFWWMYRKFVIRDIPRGGVDIFSCNKMARDAILEFSEPNSSLVAQAFWIGFKREFVPYQRRPREAGQSGWNLSRRVRYMMDSIFSFSDLPILIVLWFGIMGCILSLLFGLFVAFSRLFGFIKEPGYAALVVLITFFASASFAVQGILGSYLWRTFENTKRRPLRIVSRVIDGE